MARIQPNLDKNATKHMNLSVLKRQDPDVENILVTAGHVALYQLDLEKMQWSRKEVEGSLFVVKRRSPPLFQFVVLNQRSTENLVQDILGGFQFEISKPYLFYRHNADVNGIWFFSEQECDEVAELIQRIQSTFPSESGPPQDLSWKAGLSTSEVSAATPANLPASISPSPPVLQQRSIPLDVTALLGQQQQYHQPSLLPPEVHQQYAGAPLLAAPSSAPSHVPAGHEAATQLLAPSFFLQAPPPQPEAHTLQSQAAVAKGAIPAPSAPTNTSSLLAATSALALESLEARTVKATEAPGRSSPIKREDVRAAMLQLLQEDTFIDMLTAALNRQIVNKA